MVDPVVDQVVELEGGGQPPAGAGVHDDARQRETLLHQPALRLPLHGIARRGHALRDEERLPAPPPGLVPEPRNRVRLDRVQGQPEVRGGLDAFQDGVPPSARRPALGGAGRPRAPLRRRRLVGIAGRRPAGGAPVREQLPADRVVRAREVGEHAVEVECDAQRHGVNRAP